MMISRDVFKGIGAFFFTFTFSILFSIFFSIFFGLFFSSDVAALDPLRFDVSKQVHVLQSTDRTGVLDLNELVITFPKFKEGPLSFSSEMSVRSIHGLNQILVTGNEMQNLDLSASSSLVDLDRFIFNFRLSNNVFQLGKQHLSWNAPSYLAPSDVFNTPDLFSLSGRRRGHNAFVWKRYMSDLSFLTMLYAYPDSHIGQDHQRINHGKLGVQWVSNFAQTDFYTGLIFDGSQRFLFPSLALKGDLMDMFGVHLEVISRLDARKIEPFDLLEKVDYLLGIDGSFDDFIWGVEFYSHHPAVTAKQSSAVIDLLPFYSQTRYFMGRLTYRRPDFQTLTLAGMYSVGDGSFAPSVSYELGLLEQLDMIATAQLFMGNNGTAFSASQTGINGMYSVNFRLRF